MHVGAAQDSAAARARESGSRRNSAATESSRIAEPQPKRRSRPHRERRCLKRLQKAELDVRARRRTPSSTRSNRSSTTASAPVPRRVPSPRRGRQRLAGGDAQPGAHAERNRAGKHLDDLQSFAHDQELKAGGGSARRREGPQQISGASAARLLAHHQSHRRRRLRRGRSSPAKHRDRQRCTDRDGDGRLARDRARGTSQSQIDAAEIAVARRAPSLTSGPRRRADRRRRSRTISPALDRQANTLTVEVWDRSRQQGRQAPGPARSVRQGRDGGEDGQPNALVIPQMAVMTSPTGATFAILIDKDNKPHLRKISVGIRDAGFPRADHRAASPTVSASPRQARFELFKLDPGRPRQRRKCKSPRNRRKKEEPEES